MSIEKINQLALAARDEKPHGSPLFPPSIYYRFFKLLATWRKPELSIELGVCGGGGSLHLALGHPEGKVIGVDFQRDHPLQMNFIEKNCPNFEFMLCDSAESAQKINKKVDILFIDTDHTEDRTRKEWDAYEPYFKPGTIVCLDDLFRPGMEDVWHSLPGEKLRVDYLHDGEYPHGGGFGIILI